MGRKVLAVMCWLAVSGAGGAAVGSGLRDSVTAESTSRLYRDNVPLGVYAGAAPYGAFSVHVPAIAPANAQQYVPIKQESIVIQNSNGFLKDSYGNRFVQSPQSVAYKTTFPREFVQLQHLPAHLAQPLAATPAYHFPQGPPQAFFGAQYRLPSFDAVTSPFTRYGVAQPLLYAGAAKSPTPASDQQFQFVTPQTQQDANNNRHQVYSTQTYNQVQSEPKFQRLEEKPVARHIEHYEAPQPRQQQVAPSTHAQVQSPVIQSVKTVHNGKETVVHLETNPPLPLLDLSLLEPLTFANPVVPQVQHYLPKISSATYHKLPQFDVDEVKKHNNEFVVQKTKSYDSGVIKGKPYSDESKKNQHKPPKKDAHVHVHYESESEKPIIKVKGKPNDPNYSYEIKSPNHKETYNEQVVSYNKVTQSDPITVTYQKETQKDPVTYSYSHSSKNPGQTKTVQYVKKDPAPNNLIYNISPTGQTVKHDEAPHATAESESDDSSESSEADDESPSYDHSQYDPQHDKPTQSHHSTPASYSHQSQPSSYRYQSHSSQSQPSSNNRHPTQSYPTTLSRPSTHSHYSSTYHPSSHSQPSTHSHPTHAHPTTHSHYSTHSHPSTHSHQPHPQPLKVEPKQQSYYKPNQVHYSVSPKTPQQLTITPLNSGLQLQPLKEFVDNLRFIPPHAKAAIRVDPNQHVSHKQQNNQLPQNHVQQTTARARSEGHVSSEPVVYEKSKKIIIQEESPDEVHSHQENLSAQMVDQEENSEEDFEKSYKEAAYGFPAYDRDTTQGDEDIYNPESYGKPQNSEEDINNSPFQQYQEEGNEFPKSSRLGYKDHRDKMKENYYLDYAIAKPESMTDRYQSKIDYYKMFLKQNPEKHFGHASDDKKKQKYTVAPSFFDSTPREKTQSAQYKSAPLFEYDYLKDSRDNSARASGPGLRYRSRTHFVEPQFQYGFEPLAIPRLDSELDTMASDLSPESEKPGTRKKLYKENWYIKKTRTSSKPS